MNSIGIIGEGSWGTALLKILQHNNYHVNWLVRFNEMKESIIQTKHNPSYLSDVEIDLSKVTFFSDINDLLHNSDLIFLVLPAAFTEYLFFEINSSTLKNKFFVSATKGILPESHKTVTQYLHENLEVSMENLGFLSGPSHAEEIALERLTFLTILSENSLLGEKVSSILSNRYISITTNSDVQGAEYATALKNIMAIAAGIIHSLGFGDNFLAVFVTYAVKEIEMFLNSLVPKKRNITDYVYLGDILVTCYSQFSRNRTFGIMLGKGYSVKAAQLEMNMIAEGYYAVKSIIHIAQQKNIEMPICQAVYNILYQRYAPAIEIKLLIDKFKINYGNHSC